MNVDLEVLVEREEAERGGEHTNHPSVIVLHTPGLGNAACDAKIQEDVVHARVFVWLEAAEDDKAAAGVDHFSDFMETKAEGGKGKGGLGDIVGAEVARKRCVV